MNEKKTETLLYSAVGVAVMFVIVVAINLITGVFKTRIDMTADKLYTLSPGTRAILAKLDSPVVINFYATRGEGRMPSAFHTYAEHVEDLLGEFKQAAKGNLEIKKFDPQPDSEAEDLANLDGIEPQVLPQSGEHIYLGLSISLDPAKVALPFLSPDREKLLEYDLARAISQVMSTNKPVIGIMTPLPMFGMQMPPQMAMRMGQQGGQEPWVVVSELKRDFEVKQVPMETEKIDDDIKVLMVVHPKEIKDIAEYAIDQFILRGGRLIACLDAQSLVDSSKANPMMQMPGGGSSLDKLLKAWGITFDSSKVVADMNFARQLRAPNGSSQIMPTYLFLTAKGINKSDVATSQIDELLLPAAGTFSGTPVAGLKEDVLLHTTENSQLVDGFMAAMAGQKTVDDFKASGTSYNLAIRLTGKFKTAFPDGKPDSKGEDKKDETKKDGKADEKKSGDSLKEGKAETSVLLVGDADWLFDHFSVSVQNFFGQKIIQPRNGNLNFAQSIVEQAAGDQNLIGARSRATMNRPFTVIKEMQARANQRFQEQIGKLQKEQEDTQQRLNELQSKKETGQRMVLSKEQQDEITKFRAKQGKAKQDLRAVRRNLRQEEESLEFWTKVVNIAAVPICVAIVGLAMAAVRKQKTKAQ